MNNLQDFKEISNDPPLDMNVQLGTDGDMHKWVVTVNGPKESPYAVSYHFLSYGRVFSVASSGLWIRATDPDDLLIGWPFCGASDLTTQLPFQTPHHQLADQDLPPECFQ